MREIIRLIASHLTAGQIAALTDPGTLQLAAGIDTRSPGDKPYEKACTRPSDQR